MVPLLLRVLVTVAMALVPWALRQVPMPGLEGEDFARTGGVNVGWLALGPVVFATTLVELIAALVPRLRARRHLGPGERRPLRVATVVVAIVSTLVASVYIAVALQSVRAAPPGFGASALVVIAIGGGVVAASLAAVVVSRWGIGHGLAVLWIVDGLGSWLVDNALPQTFAPSEASGFDAPKGQLFDLITGQPDRSFVWRLVAFVVAMTALVLLLRRRRARAAPSGLAPIAVFEWCAFVIASIGWLAGVDSGLGDALAGWLPLLGASAIALGLGWFYARPLTGWLGLLAIGSGVAYVAAVGYLDRVIDGRALTPIAVVGVATALLFDLARELFMRLRGEANAVAWTFYDLARAERVSERLIAHAIPHHLAGTHVMHLRRITAPWAPVRLLVPREHREAAEALARAEESRPLVDAALTALE